MVDTNGEITQVKDHPLTHALEKISALGPKAMDMKASRPFLLWMVGLKIVPFLDVYAPHGVSSSSSGSPVRMAESMSSIWGGLDGLIFSAIERTGGLLVTANTKSDGDQKKYSFILDSLMSCGGGSSFIQSSINLSKPSLKSINMHSSFIHNNDNPSLDIGGNLVETKKTKKENHDKVNISTFHEVNSDTKNSINLAQKQFWIERYPPAFSVSELNLIQSEFLIESTKDGPSGFDAKQEKYDEKSKFCNITADSLVFPKCSGIAQVRTDFFLTDPTLTANKMSERLASLSNTPHSPQGFKYDVSPILLDAIAVLRGAPISNQMIVLRSQYIKANVLSKLCPDAGNCSLTEKGESCGLRIYSLLSSSSWDIEELGCLLKGIPESASTLQDFTSVFFFQDGETKKSILHVAADNFNKGDDPIKNGLAITLLAGMGFSASLVDKNFESPLDTLYSGSTSFSSSFTEEINEFDDYLLSFVDSYSSSEAESVSWRPLFHPAVSFIFGSADSEGPSKGLMAACLVLAGAHRSSVWKTNGKKIMHAWQYENKKSSNDLATSLESSMNDLFTDSPTFDDVEMRLLQGGMINVKNSLKASDVQKEEQAVQMRCEKRQRFIVEELLRELGRKTEDE